MQQNDHHHAPTPTEKALQESIQSLSRSLTVVVACTQLLQRQSQDHKDVASEKAEQRIAMIDAAANDMVETLRQLQDVYGLERD